MKRYDFVDGDRWDLPEGDWVTHEDAQAAIQAAVQTKVREIVQLCIAHDYFGTRPSQLADLIQALENP